MSYFRRFPYTNRRKRPKMTEITQLRRIVSQQPLGVEKQVSTFWKEDEQGCNICENERKDFFTQGPPPCRLKVERKMNPLGKPEMQGHNMSKARKPKTLVYNPSPNVIPAFF